VIYMENYDTVNAPCADGDCDNLGHDRKHNIKVMLVDASTASGNLKEHIKTAASIFPGLSEVYCDRAFFTDTMTAYSQVATAFRTACTTNYTRIRAALSFVYTQFQTNLPGFIASDPGWAGSLDTQNNLFTNSSPGIQYYYDFLKDLAETYNELRNLLFNDYTWCCPDISAFPKHLLAGSLNNPDDVNYRTGFYPSPAVNRCCTHQNKVKFLVDKITAMFSTFSVSVSSATSIKITPSYTEDISLEKRAIPYYLPASNANLFYQKWSYEKHVKNMDGYNYSYHAGSYTAAGAASNPLQAQIANHPFFRIEGHLGHDVLAALNDIEAQIKNKNLPFAVHVVMLGSDHSKVKKKPGYRYWDINRMHQVLRKSISDQMDKVSQFNDSFYDQVNYAVDHKQVDNTVPGNSGSTLKQTANQKHSSIKTGSANLKTKMEKSYPQYRQDNVSGNTWNTDLNTLMKDAGEFKYNTKEVINTSFVTPFDALIASYYNNWLNWIDILIGDKNDKYDTKLLFTQFLKDNPGVDHLAGAYRGGTFILVYDSTYTVVADFVLPYIVKDEIFDSVNEPNLTTPGIWSGWVLTNGLEMKPTIDKYLIDNWLPKIDEVKNDFEKQFNLQQQLLGYYVTAGNPGPATDGPINENKFSDPASKYSYKTMTDMTNEILALREKGDTAAMQKAQGNLLTHMQQTMKDIKSGKISVKPGTDGYSLLVSMNDYASHLPAKDAKNFQQQIGNMLNQ
jgi:hypothetical protein